MSPTDLGNPSTTSTSPEMSTNVTSGAAREFHLDDNVVLSLELEDCPMAEIPLTELFDVDSSMLYPTYTTVISNTVYQQLEDTAWLEFEQLEDLWSIGYCMYSLRPNGVVSIRDEGFQRLINQCLSNRDSIDIPISIPVVIRFRVARAGLPRPNSIARDNRFGNPTTPSGIRSPLPRGSDPTPAAQGFRADQNTADASTLPIDPTPSAAVRLGTDDNEYRAANIRDESSTPLRPATVQSFFRGIPINLPPPVNLSGHDNQESLDDEDRNHGYTRPEVPVSSYGHHNISPPRMHEVIYGPESYDDYMSQFQGSEIKYKDFKKAKIAKFDAKTDSFIHWYKLFCTTCLQWGIWCPPYESTKMDHIHGSWWPSLPRTVRANESFMSSLIYAMLSQENLFAANSKEYGAVHGCPPNAGYHAIYSLLRLHHPLLHSVLSTANDIPRQRRNESFSSYIRRLQDFIARERVANRRYVDVEALDLAVRNLLPEWRTEFRRMVERDKRARPSDPFPFKHSMSQLATTFLEYAIEIGKDPPSSGASAVAGTSRHNPLIINRIDSRPMDDDDDVFPQPDDGFDLILRVIDQRQAASPVCIGCQQSGHTLTECHRFIDYVIAQKLADNNPQLKAKVAAAHAQFRTRPRPAHRAREHASRTVNRIDNGTPHASDVLDPDPLPTTETAIIEAPLHPDSNCYQQNAIRTQECHFGCDEDPFSEYSLSSLNSVIVSPDQTRFSPIWSDTVTIAPAVSDSVDDFVLRRLANTFDTHTGAVHAVLRMMPLCYFVTVHSLIAVFAYSTLVNISIVLLAWVFSRSLHVLPVSMTPRTIYSWRHITLIPSLVLSFHTHRSPNSFLRMDTTCLAGPIARVLSTFLLPLVRCRQRRMFLFPYNLPPSVGDSLSPTLWFAHRSKNGLIRPCLPCSLHYPLRALTTPKGPIRRTIIFYWTLPTVSTVVFANCLLAIYRIFAEPVTSYPFL